MQIQKQIITPVDRIAGTYEFILRAVRWHKTKGMECAMADIQSKLGAIGLFDENYLENGYHDLARTIRKLERWGLLSSQRSKPAGSIYQIKHKILFLTVVGAEALQKLDEMKGKL